MTWIKKKTGPAVEVIKSTSDAEDLLDVGTPIAVAYLKSVEVLSFTSLSLIKVLMKYKLNHAEVDGHYMQELVSIGSGGEHLQIPVNVVER